MPDSATENVSSVTCATVIIFIGNPFDITELYICGENEILVHNIKDAYNGNNSFVLRVLCM